MVVHELFSYLYLPLHDSRLLESEPWGEMTAEIVRGLMYKLPQAGQSKTGKSGATSHHILFVCVCVCVCPTVRWKVYPAFQAFFRRSSSLSGLGWDFVSESTCLSWEAHSWEGDRGVGMCACRRGDVDIQMEVRSRRGGGRGWMNDMRGCKHMLEHEWSQT